MIPPVISINAVEFTIPNTDTAMDATAAENIKSFFYWTDVNLIEQNVKNVSIKPDTLRLVFTMLKKY